MIDCSPDLETQKLRRLEGQSDGKSNPDLTDSKGRQDGTFMRSGRTTFRRAEGEERRLAQEEHA